MKLEEIEKLCNQTTPGPWEWDFHQLVSTLVDDTDDGITSTIEVMAHSGIGSPNNSNKKFIAASRTLMPKLLAVANAAKMLQSYRQKFTDPYDIPIWETELERLLEELEKD